MATLWLVNYFCLMDPLNFQSCYESIYMAVILRLLWAIIDQLVFTGSIEWAAFGALMAKKGLPKNTLSRSSGVAKPFTGHPLLFCAEMGSCCVIW
jgi:hypothetical protein